MKKVLLTGASGFLGHHVLGSLVSAGCEVTALSRTPRQAPDVEWVAGSLLDTDFQASLFSTRSFDTLIHLAWETRHGYFWSAPENLSWVRASCELLERFVAADGRRFVGSGTGAEYAPPDEGPCVAGHTPLEPQHLYSISKNAFHQVAQSYASNVDLEFVWARVFSVLGERDDPRRLVPSTISAIANGRPVHCSSGNQVRDFMDIRDCGAAFSQIALSSLCGEVNVCSGIPISIRGLVEEIAQLMGRPEVPKFGVLPDREGEFQNVWGEPFGVSSDIEPLPQRTRRQTLDWAIERWKTNELE